MRVNNRRYKQNQGQEKFAFLKKWQLIRAPTYDGKRARKK